MRDFVGGWRGNGCGMGMADNLYVLDLWVTGADLVTVNDDGTGTDTIQVAGVYAGVVEIDLVWTAATDGTLTASGSYEGKDDKDHQLIISGVIENVIGSNGSDLIQGNLRDNSLIGDTSTGLKGNDDTLMGGGGG